jgi:hypothetical protein
MKNLAQKQTGIRNLHRVGGTLLVLLLVLSIHGAAPATAQSGSGYDIPWWTVDGGGANPAAGSSYRLGGVVGQADAAVWQSAAGYTLVGGFWSGGAAGGGYHIYLPLVLRNSP